MRNAKWIVLLSLAVMLVTYGCVAMEPQKVPENAALGEFKAKVPGTQFVVKTTQNGKTTNEKYTVIEDTIKDEKVLVEKRDDGKIGHVYDPETNNWKGEWDYENGDYNRSAAPSSNQYSFPLFVGKKYPATFNYDEKGGWSGKVDRSAKVQSMEKFSINGDTYDVYKIKIISQGGTINTMWYSPALSRNVKSTMFSRSRGESTSELVSIKIP